jgi:hypothetical protein
LYRDNELLLLRCHLHVLYFAQLHNMTPNFLWWIKFKRILRQWYYFPVHFHCYQQRVKKNNLPIDPESVVLPYFSPLYDIFIQHSTQSFINHLITYFLV